MKRKASEITMEEKQERQQIKRERKASDAGSPHAFGHSSADAVLNPYMQSDETHDGSVKWDKDEEQIHKFRGLKNWQQCKRKIEIIDVDDLEEDDHKLADERKRIEVERTVCHAAEDEYSALLQNIKKRRKDKHVSEEGKKQCVSITPSVPIFESFWSSFESDHYVNNNGSEGSFWNRNFEDGGAQCVLNQPISKSEDMFTNSVLNFDNHHHSDNNGDRYFHDKDLEDSNVLCVSTELTSNSEDILLYSSPLVGDRHGSNNSREGSFSWYIDLEDDKAEWVPYQPILKSEDILSSTLNFESDHHGNNNGGDGYFWDKDLEDAIPLRVSGQLISKFGDILPNSSPFSFESNQRHLAGDHHGSSNTNGESFSRYIDLEDDKAQCVPNHNDGERDAWNKDLDDGKALCVTTQLGPKSEDMLSKSLPLSFESNHHHEVDDEHGNNNGDNGIFQP